MARWHSCNVLHTAHDVQHLWQFSASGKFALQRDASLLLSERLPEKAVGKDWQTLFQARLNVAWLPTDKAFLRVIHLPASDSAETQSMVELQLEKLSPLPVAQILWGFEVLPHAELGMQTIVVIIVARTHAEEFLGQIEARGFLADRLEVPFIEQLAATKPDEDDSSCLVAWWYGRTLRNLSIVHLPAGERRAPVLQDQLTQMTWSGELEGWITAPPQFNLVVQEAKAPAWRALFPVEQSIRIVPPLGQKELAALAARRTSTGDPQTNLLPPEYTARYKQQFVDRLWMRGLGAIVALYIFVVAAYLGWAQFAKWRYTSVQDKVAAIGPTYTNTLQLKERVRVMQDQLDLQYAALDCYKAVADNLPAELTLDNINFERGRTLRLFGTAGNDDVEQVQEFNEAIRKVVVKGQPLFGRVTPPNSQRRPGGQQISWNFAADLKRGESP